MRFELLTYFPALCCATDQASIPSLAHTKAPSRTRTKTRSMASARARLIFRLVLATLLLLLLYYGGRPLYWKISATIHDIRANKQTVSGGISQIMYEAQRSVGWLHDGHDHKSAAARRILDLSQEEYDDTDVKFLLNDFTLMEDL